MAIQDLKALTVKHLRELAREHLGPGYSKKTREEILEAFKKVPAILRAAVAEATLQAATGAAHPTPAHPGSEPDAEATPVRSARQRAAEPLVEGFFVSRIAGEGEARRHHLTEEQARPPRESRSAPGYDERLGELPDSYQDDAAVLLARDPSTLFFFWDFHSQTRQAAATSLTHPHAVICVYDGATVVREVDFALESRSFYLHGLSPGRQYRVEARFVGADGRSHRIGHGTNMVRLPPFGPSDKTEVRFMRIPWGLPVSRLRELLRDGRASVEVGGDRAAYADWTHAWSPSSADWPLRASGPSGPGASVRTWLPSPSGHRES